MTEASAFRRLRRGMRRFAINLAVWATVTSPSWAQTSQLNEAARIAPPNWETVDMHVEMGRAEACKNAGIFLERYSKKLNEPGQTEALFTAIESMLAMAHRYCQPPANK